MHFRPPRLQFLRDALAGRPRTLTSLVVATALAVFLGGGYMAWFAYDITAGLPDKDELRGLSDMAQSTTIYDAADTPVFTIFKEQRIEIPLSQVSRNLIDAVVSVEDQRFYEHGGVDAIRVAAAVLKNLQEGRRAEGGSTITQQLARQSFLTRDKTYRRKLKEVILATYLENLFTKEEILELYLNKVYFGDGLYGIEAASRGYFGKSASDLTVDEAALLAGLIQSPSSYAPTVNLDRAIARRNVVLSTMVSSGAIDEDEAARARKNKVKLTNSLEIKETYGLYFKEHVRRELVDKFGWERVYQGGLRVYTTMDPELQQAGEKLVEQGLVEIENRRGFSHPRRAGHAELQEGEEPNYLQAALVSMDPASGHVRAMVGGRDFTESRFNRAVQAKRQSGSAFKPFVFAAALEAGFSPATMITRLNDPTLTPEGEWVPEDGHSTASAMTLRTALRTSSNRAAVQLLHSVGIPEAVGYAEKLNVGTPPSVPSMALGTSEVTLISLTAAYGAFANGGIVRNPVTIRRVEDSEGTVLFDNIGTSQRAVSESTAFLMASMLSDVVNAGTAYRARQVGFTAPAAGKTGTTNDYVDAWFVGFTPRVVTGVWIGFDQPTSIIRNGYAGELAVPMWARFMKEATKGHKTDWIPRPSNVVGANVCRLSGKLPNDGCGEVETIRDDGETEVRSLIYTEYFVRGTVPTSVCPLHDKLSFFERIAGAFRKDGDDKSPDEPEVQAAAADIPSAGTRSAIRTMPGTVVPAPVAAANVKKDEETDEDTKKRGFWSRLFGRGDDDKKDDDKKKEEEKKPDVRKKPGGEQ